MAATDKLFMEMFRAKSLHNLVLPPRVSSELASGLNTNILLYGPAGTGKTSIAKILSKDYETLELNGSLENGIDVVRDRVESFASTLSIMNGSENLRVVFIDECDGFSESAWKSLRHLIEEYHANTRFICTCNLIDKIPPYIKSRFNCIAAYPITVEEESIVMAGYCNIISKILAWEGIEHTEEGVRAIMKRFFPDMRSILNTLQSFQNQGIKNLSEANIGASFDCNDLFEMIINGNDPNENYTFVMSNYSNKVDDAMSEISKNFVDYMRGRYPDKIQKIPQVVITIADYMSQLPNAIDRAIVLLACVFRLQMIVRQ